MTPVQGAHTAVVVLGFSCDHGKGVPSEPLQHRLRHGAAVATRSAANYLLCTGGLDVGHDPSLPTEAEIMGAWLTETGELGPIPPVVLLEKAATSTRENALYSLRVLREQVRKRMSPHRDCVCALISYKCVCAPHAYISSCMPRPPL